MKSLLPKDAPNFLLARFSVAKIASEHIKYTYAHNIPLYHYSNIDALISIIENNCIWLSEARYLNDKEELIDGKNKTIELIRYLMDKKSFKYKIFEDVLLRVIDKLNNTKYKDYYICSFSKKKDDLEQWRAYGSNGSGICIEFMRNKEKNSLFEIFNLWNFCKVTYNDEKKYKIIHATIFKYFYYYSQDVKLKNKIYTDEYIDSLSFDLIHEFILFKNESFKSEEEIRLIYNGNQFDKDFDKKYFRNSNGIIVPYIKSNEVKIKGKDENGDLKLLSQMQKLPISKIIIGPTLNKENMQQSIEEFLKHNDYVDVIVETSKIPYR